MITDLGHTALRVHDLDASLAFYAKLGLTESFRLHHEDGSLMLVYLHLGGDRFLELFPGGPPPPTAAGSFMHICLVTDDLEAQVAELEAAGITIDSPPSVRARRQPAGLDLGPRRQRRRADAAQRDVAAAAGNARVEVPVEAAMSGSLGDTFAQ